jgi:multidrug transporter EmrE-like cation transporter
VLIVIVRIVFIAIIISFDFLIDQKRSLLLLLAYGLKLGFGIVMVLVESSITGSE